MSFGGVVKLMEDGNLFDYIEWRGDLTFAQSRLNAVDALILSVLAYVNYPYSGFSEISLAEILESWNQLPEEEQVRVSGSMGESCRRLAHEVSVCKRFRDIRLACYKEITDEKTEEQFSAMTFLLPDSSVFVSYRGTDNSLVGWKEDLNMSFINGTPSQLEAVKFAERAAKDYPDSAIHLGGHSKGGNLAMWAAVHLPENIQERLSYVYNNDGPGLLSSLVSGPEYARLTGKILSFVPESSVIGVLMGNADYITIKSKNVSLLQHDPFTWSVSGPKFVYGAERTASGQMADKFFNGIINNMTPEELSDFAEDLYNELRSDNEETVDDLKKHLLSNVFNILVKFGILKLNSTPAVREIREFLQK